ncbi:MAG: hypothetical protein ACRDP7_34310 [Trebonia sp.]
MTGRTWQLGLLAAVPLLAAGCAAAQPVAHGSPSPGMSRSPGMSMPGMTPAAAGPSVSAQMICSAEIRADVATLFALRNPAPATSSWVSHLYTCTYQLPAGRLVLSVKESPDVPAARRYFNALRQHLGATKPLLGMSGLGMPAYEADGTAVFLKDDKTLQVNATALPARAGPTSDTRTDLAYTIATDILACWTGK